MPVLRLHKTTGNDATKPSLLTMQAEAEHEAERSSEGGSDADERYLGSMARGHQGLGHNPDPRAELETDLAVEALLAAAAGMGANGPGSGSPHDATLLQVCAPFVHLAADYNVCNASHLVVSHPADAVLG